MKLNYITLGFLAVAATAAPAHKDGNAPVILNKISRFDCVKNCWHELYPKIERYDQKDVCKTHIYALKQAIAHKIVPCVKSTCDHRDKDEIILESRRWWKDWCGWLPASAEKDMKEKEEEKNAPQY